MPTDYRDTDKHLGLVMTLLCFKLVVFALWCTRQSGAPDIDRCDAVDNDPKYRFFLHMVLPYITTVSPKRKYTLMSSQVLKTEGGQMKNRGCAKPTIELVQTGPSLILKLHWRCDASPTFPVLTLDFEYFLLVESVWNLIDLSIYNFPHGWLYLGL